jgi:hypothetical protein
MADQDIHAVSDGTIKKLFVKRRFRSRRPIQVIATDHTAKELLSCSLQAQ